MDETRLKDLLFDALERPESERAAFLDAACGDDSALRDRVQTLLQAHDRADQALGHDPLGITPLADRARASDGAAHADPGGDADDPRPGDVIGAYTLGELLGEGGFGTVHRATQHEPVRRTVALKLVRANLDGAAVVARLQAERQALALMDHPSIARVFDAGSTERGRPFFVMELVDGEPITDWCARRKLPLVERLALFANVCHALQHAHQKGVVHRDVKPGNVLVTEVDGRPVPKVIDFGIAKALDQPLTDSGNVTTEGMLVGTPGCMSPEQVEQRADVDTRADVYALGVLLYELICGVPPFTQGERGLLELVRAVREDDPPRPGLVRRSGQGDDERGVPTDARIPADVDWVVMRCLEKDRERRYPTAFALAQDVERLVDQRPVEAAPPSRFYRVRKLARRHRAAVLLGSLALLAVLGGGTGTTLGYLAEADANRELDGALAREKAEATRAREAEQLAVERLARAEQAERRARDEADAADAARALAEQRAEQLAAAKLLAEQRADEASAARQLAETNANQARDAEAQARDAEALAALRAVEADRRARTAEAVTSFLGDDLLAAAAPSADPGRGRDVKVRDVLSIASRRASVRFPEEPLVEGAVRYAMGRTYAKLGLHDEAAHELSRAVDLAETHAGPDDDDALLAGIALADVQRRRGRWDSTRSLLDELLPRLERVHGADHEYTLGARRVEGQLLWESGLWDEAYALLTRTEATATTVLGEEHPLTLELRASLAVLAVFNADQDVAEPLFRSTYRLAAARFGPHDPDTLVNQVNLANYLRGVGAFAEAETLYADALAVLPEIVGPDHPTTLMAAQGLGRLLVDVGRIDEGLVWLEPAVRRAAETLGPGHADTLELRSAQVRAYERQGRLAEAETLAAAALQASRESHGDDHPSTFQRGKELASVLYSAGRIDEYEPLMRWVHDGELAALGPDHRTVLVSARNLAIIDVMRGRLTQAETRLVELDARCQRLLGAGDVQSIATRSDLAGVLIEQARGADAEALLRPLIAQLDDFDPSGGPRRAEAYERLGRALALQGRESEAVEALDEAERAFAAMFGRDSAPFAAFLAERALTGL